MYSKMSYPVTMNNQFINDQEYQNIAKLPHIIKHPLLHHPHQHLLYTHQNMQYLNNDPNHYPHLYHLNPVHATVRDTIRRSYAESQSLHPRLSKRCYPTLRRYYEPEMNIIYLDREPIPDIYPLPVPPTNPHIVLDFLSRDHEWFTEHHQNIQNIDSNVYQKPNISSLYVMIDKYNLSQINHLRNQLRSHFSNTGRPTTIPTNSFPYVLLLIGNILDFLHYHNICLPPKEIPQDYQPHEQKRDDKMKQILLAILRVANPQTYTLLPKGDNSLQCFGWIFGRFGQHLPPRQILESIQVRASPGT